MDKNAFPNDTSTRPFNDSAPEVSPAQTSNSNLTEPIMSSELSESPIPKKQKKILIWVVSIAIVFLVSVIGIVFVPKLFEKSNQPSDNLESLNQNEIGNLEGIDFDFIKLENNSKNILYSPLSIRNGLALLQSGANGKTKNEIDKVLTDTSIPKYQNIPDVLSLANAVFIRDTFEDKILPSFTENAQNNLNSEILYDAFESSNNMDNWVKQKTFNLIGSIGIQPTPNLQMVLANALAIQMSWKHQFDTNRTHGNSFYQNDGTEIQATTMHMDSNSSDIKYLIDDDTTAFSMPLDSTSEKTNLNFVAIMPSGDLGEYIKNLESSNIKNIINALKPASEFKDGVAISIPKFKFGYELKFKDDLEYLGIRAAFNPDTADFSKITPEPLFVSDAVHKANIDFSEDGIKAAAITVFAMKNAATRLDEEPQAILLNIDHPFIFLICDEENNAIWFTGAVYQPNLWDEERESYRPSR